MTKECGLCSAPAEEISCCTECRKHLVAKTEVASYILSLRIQLGMDRRQYLFYEAQHRAKKTAESDKKAEVNAKLAQDVLVVLTAGSPF